MNKEEMGLFNDLWYIGTDMMAWEYKESADKLKEKIIKTFEENKQLKANRDEAIKYIENHKATIMGAYGIPMTKVNELKTILEEGIGGNV